MPNIIEEEPEEVKIQQVEEEPEEVRPIKKIVKKVKDKVDEHSPLIDSAINVVKDICDGMQL